MQSGEQLVLVRDRIGVKPLYFYRKRRPLHFRFRDQGDPAASCSDPGRRRACALSLSDFPHDTRATNALQRHSETAGGPHAGREA